MVKAGCSQMCNNFSCNSNSRREIDEDREQRTNTTLKKDTVQTTSTNNSTPITPFYMQLRYSISPVTRCADSSTTSAPANPCLAGPHISDHDGIESLILALRRPCQASLEQSLIHQADVGRLAHFKNCLWHVVVNIL